MDFRMIFRLIRRFYKSVRQRGICHTVATGLRALRTTPRWCRPETWQRWRSAHVRSKQFDELFGVDTAGVHSLNEFAIASDNVANGVRYEPIDPDDFRAMLGKVGDITGYTFIDFGAGKGRAMLLAAEWPFLQIIGVEFAPELARQARDNLKRYQNSRQMCHRLEIIEGDAIAFPLPPGPLVLFFYNPFGKQVMSRVVKNLAQSLAVAPRPVVVLYHTCEELELWSSLPGFAELPTIHDSACFSNRLNDRVSTLKCSSTSKVAS